MTIFLRLILLVCLVFAGQSNAATTAVAHDYGVNAFQAGVESINNNGLINPSGCCSNSLSRDSHDRAQTRSFFALAADFYVPNSALKQFGRSVDELSSAASQPFKNTGLTKAARALDKHAAGQRSSGTFPPLSGNAAARNKQAQQIVDDILNNSKSEFKTLGRGGLEVRSPSGQGVRFDKDGTFSGFVD